MSGKRERDYRKVLQEAKRILEMESENTQITQKIVMDFEAAMWKAVHSNGCFLAVLSTSVSVCAGNSKVLGLVTSYKKCSAVAETGDRLATIDMGRKLGAVPPFSRGVAGSPCNTMWSGPRPTFVPSGVLIHLAVWPQ